jgi:hypothetical protein
MGRRVSNVLQKHAWVLKFSEHLRRHVFLPIISYLTFLYPKDLGIATRVCLRFQRVWRSHEDVLTRLFDCSSPQVSARMIVDGVVVSRVVTDAFASGNASIETPEGHARVKVERRFHVNGSAPL